MTTGTPTGDTGSARCEECATRLSTEEAASRYGPSEYVLCADCAYTLGHVGVANDEVRD